ncbi:MAG: histidine kinase [Haliscomenobacter sp.]|nr:histidine kinase [Haliscomenobacter sp.]MBK9488049.1 histidine kinase [Haliscomenobacter sp.]
MFQRIAKHVLFWAIIWLWTTMLWMNMDCEFSNLALASLFRMPLLMAATYFNNYFLIPRYLVGQRNYLAYGGLFLLLVGILWFLDRSWMLLWVFSAFMEDLGYNFYFFYYLPNVQNLFIFISVMLFAAVIRFSRIWYETEMTTRKLAAEKQATELAFLKAQVNPHFLFNTLNSLYALAVEKNQEELGQSIASLAGMMRYLTYESNAEKVPLRREVDQIGGFIEIQHLRLSDDDDVIISLNTQGEMDGKMIAPAILIPFVENALKHGIDVTKRSMVKIEVIVEDKTLHFSTKNTKQTATTLNQEGIGLENVRKRLSLLYPERHTLRIVDEGGYFSVHLTLTLDE